ncbi:hypothetical protein ANCDUO_11949, partial [Ancylostoma duodenale]
MVSGVTGGGNYSKESTNVFHEILVQLRKEMEQKEKVPDYFVHSAGTGGTISSVGRYVKRYNLRTRILLADSQYSLFYDYAISNKYEFALENVPTLRILPLVYRFTNESGTKIWKPPGIAGTGYGNNVDPVIYGETTSLTRSIVDEAMKMPDIASVAAMYVLKRRGIGGGASTALNFLASLQKAWHGRKVRGRLTIVTIIGDPGEYYKARYFNSTWIDEKFVDEGGMEALRCWRK